MFSGGTDGRCLFDRLDSESGGGTFGSRDTSPYSAATDDEWLAKLKNAFWLAVLDQVISGYEMDEDGTITETDGTATLSSQLQYLIVLYACMDVVRNQLLQMKTVFRAKAGPVEYETQQSAQVLKALLDQFMNQRDRILDTLASTSNLSTYYIDAVRSRDYAIRIDATDWVV